MRKIILILLIHIAIANSQVIDERCDPNSPSQLFPSTSCERYLLCTWGWLYERTCPDGYHFSPTRLVCEIASSAGCKPGGETSKVKVDIYYESLCPDSINFVQSQLAPNYQSLKQHLDITFIPFGKASSLTDPGTGQSIFQCQHGPEECFGNKVQGCMLKRLPKQDDQVKYVSCQMNFAANPDHRQCVELQGFNWNEIYNCAVGSEGTNIALQYEQLTIWTVGVTNWVPTILYNRQITDDCCMFARPFKTVICNYIANANPVCKA